MTTVQVKGRLVGTGSPLQGGSMYDNDMQTFEFVGLPVYSESQTVSLNWMENTSGLYGSVDTLTPSENGYIYTVGSDMSRYSSVIAYIRITNRDYIWNTKEFYISLNKLPDVSQASSGIPSTNVIQQALDIINKGIGFITPEMFGAVGDGVTDDTDAITAFMNDPCTCKIFTNSKTYAVTRIVCTDFPGGMLIGYGSKIKETYTYITTSDSQRYRNNLIQDFITPGKTTANNWDTTTVLNRVSNRDLIILGLTIEGNADNYVLDDVGLAANGYSLIRMVGFKKVEVRDCDFSHSGNTAITIENVWEDALFDNCRFNNIGKYIPAEYENDPKSSAHTSFRWEAIALGNYVGREVAGGSCPITFGKNFIVQNCYFDHVLNSPFGARNFTNLIAKDCLIENSNVHIWEIHPKIDSQVVNITLENIQINGLAFRLLTIMLAGNNQKVRVSIKNVRVYDFGDGYVFSLNPTNLARLIWADVDDGSNADIKIDIDGLHVIDGPLYDDDRDYDYIESDTEEFIRDKLNNHNHGLKVGGELNITNSRFDLNDGSVVKRTGTFFECNKLTLNNTVVNGYAKRLISANTVFVDNCQFSVPQYGNTEDTRCYFASGCSNSVRLTNNEFNGFKDICRVIGKPLESFSAIGNYIDQADIITFNELDDFPTVKETVGLKRGNALDNVGFNPIVDDIVTTIDTTSDTGYRRYFKSINNTTIKKVSGGVPVDSSEYHSGYIISKNSTVDIENPTQAATMKYLVLDCEQNDAFTIYGAGGSDARLWTFIKSGTENNRILPQASNNATYTAESPLLLVAPPEAVKLVINLKSGSTAPPYQVCRAVYGSDLDENT